MMVYTTDFPELDISETRVINDHKVRLVSDVQGEMQVDVEGAVLPVEDLLRLIGPQRMVERFHQRNDWYSDSPSDFDPSSPSHFIDHYGDSEVSEQELVNLISLRKKLLYEENNEELFDALDTLQEVLINYRDGRNYTTQYQVTETLRWVAKEISDVIVVAVGTAARLGLQVDESFLEVARSNLTKVSPPEHREDGKIQKGPNYVAPRPERLLTERF